MYETDLVCIVGGLRGCGKCVQGSFIVPCRLDSIGENGIGSTRDELAPLALSPPAQDYTAASHGLKGKWRLRGLTFLFYLYGHSDC